MSGSVSKLRVWIGGAGVPGVVARDHTEVVTPLSIPAERGGESFGCASVITAGLVVQGPVNGLGPLVIAGAVHGDVRVSGSVMVLPTAWVDGAISGAHVEIHGHVQGTVDADRLTLRCGGRVLGDVICGQLRVDPGGRLDGRCTMEGNRHPHLAEVPYPPPFGVLSA